MNELEDRLNQIRELAEAGLDAAIDAQPQDHEYLMSLFADIWDLADLDEPLQ